MLPSPRNESRAVKAARGRRHPKDNKECRLSFSFGFSRSRGFPNPLKVGIPTRHAFEAERLEKVSVQHLPVTKHQRILEDLKPPEMLSAAFAFGHRQS